MHNEQAMSRVLNYYEKHTIMIRARKFKITAAIDIADPFMQDSSTSLPQEADYVVAVSSRPASDPVVRHQKTQV